ncbi:UDP-N-acetylmuramate--L-alanine ligase [Candidatus Pacearchaeota archaeon]|nr:UDP-N-acetylmuramate--L-alanine ligase [Candidatus Pacearchaeota archaeon]
MKNAKHIHFIGIGGIGISALAHLALAEGKKVTGSDAFDSDLIEDLIHQGAHITIGHSEDNVDSGAELVIYTEAIDRDNNPEYKRAKALGIPTLSYFQALGQLTQNQKTIVVAGTHGKTTTTAMGGLALISAGLDATVIVGSKVKEFHGRNIRIGKGDLLMVEGCEYRRSFLSLHPYGVVLLNCELEHLDYYRDEADYMEAYIELIKSIPPHGFLVANMDDAIVRKMIHHCAGTLIPVTHKEVSELDLEVGVLGDFNQMNATHAYFAVKQVGGEDEKIREALKNFGGTWRRLETKGSFKKALVIDDYGHHPTEIKATLKAVKEAYGDRPIVCVFQPHQYSRTHLMIEEFKGSFGDADQVIIPNIYEARDSDDDKSKIDAEKLVDILKTTHSNVMWGDGFDNTYKLLSDIAEKDCVIITMGAGTIGTLASRLVS